MNDELFFYLKLEKDFLKNRFFYITDHDLSEPSDIEKDKMISQFEQYLRLCNFGDFERDGELYLCELYHIFFH